VTAALPECEYKVRLDFAMRKYLTRRCIGLHVLTLLLVSSFLLATWWQYESALGGNGLSWAYVFEWPAFAIYAVYMWWRLIHDKHTAFDKLWAARQHAAADAFGTPLYQIPGWALDQTLRREVVASSLEAAGSPELFVGPGQTFAPAQLGDGQRNDRNSVVSAQGEEPEEGDSDGRVIDAQVLDVKVHTDEELNAYNRYLSELNWTDPPKNWGARWPWRRGASKVSRGNPPREQPPDEQRGELPVGDRDRSSRHRMD
jgi:hypothetical protein